MTFFSDLRTASSNLTLQTQVSKSTKRDRIIRVFAGGPIVAILSLLLLQAALAGGAAAKTPTTTSLTSSATNFTVGQAVTFTATVGPLGSPSPTGTVTFLDGPNQVGQVAVDANGQAQFTTSALPTGQQAITAFYGGDANFASSSGQINVTGFPATPVTITVTPANQTLILGGNTQQYTSTETYPSGSRVDVTNLATWASSNQSIATISAAGLASTTGSGYTSITASYNGATSPPVTLGVKAPGGYPMFLGGGSSAMFLELGQAAQSSPVTNTPCVWTHSSLFNDAGATDSRPASFPSTLPVDEYGEIWITWSPGSGTCAAPAGNYDVYAYTSLDSVLGVRCYFEVDDSTGNSGCKQIISSAAGTAGSNLLCNSANPCPYGPDTPLPQSIITTLQGQHWFAAGTDILPEDAKFSLMRMFTPCGQPIWRQPFDQGLRQTYGLGYQGTIAHIGQPVFSHFRNFSYHTLDFNYTGDDPIITNMPVPQYSLTTLGAKPILVAVSPAGGTGIGAATDITSFTLALFEEGILGRNTDLIGPTATAPVTTLINEPFSGPYNVMEYSVPNSSQFHTSQDDNNCDGAGGVYSNGMNLQSNNGKFPAFRVRVLGTNEMIGQIQAGTASDQRLGYLYWSAANASSFTTTNGKYLAVNGVDPLQDNYTDGVLPGVDSAHPLSNVTFKWMNAGDYPIWSVLRIISRVPTPIGVTNLVAAAQGLNVSQHNFIDTANLQVWHSHYYLPVTGNGVAALGNTINAPGDLCPIPNALTEYGGDLGGANALKQANIDFCSDFGNINGLINKAN